MFFLKTIYDILTFTIKYIYVSQLLNWRKAAFLMEQIISMNLR